MKKVHQNIVTIESGKRGSIAMQSQREYTAVIQKSGRWYVAWLEELPGVNTQGRTLREVKENLLEALTLFLEETRKISTAKHRAARREYISVAVPNLIVA